MSIQVTVYRTYYLETSSPGIIAVRKQDTDTGSDNAETMLTSMEPIRSNVTLVEPNVSSLIPPSWEDSVRTVRMSEYREVGLSLAHSFATDHLSLYLLGADDMAHLTPEQKWKIHLDLMTSTSVATLLKGVITTVGPEHDSVALVLPPGGDIDGWWVALRSGLWRMYYLLSPQGRRRDFTETLPVLHNAKVEVMGARDNDCYYLLYLGTKPKARGRGYAGRLIRHMCKVADTAGRPIYLESSSESNTKYYTKFGFETKKVVSLGDEKDAFLLSLMVREPQNRGVDPGKLESVLVKG